MGRVKEVRPVYFPQPYRPVVCSCLSRLIPVYRGVKGHRIRTPSTTNMTFLEYLADVLPSPIYSFLLTFMSNVLNLFTAFLRLATTFYSQSPFEWDAQTLLPPIISILAAYLALASLYRTTSWMFRTGLWFVKWGIILAALLATTGWFMENTQGNTIGNYMSIGGSIWNFVADSSQKTPPGSSSSRSRKARPKPWESFERHREWQYQEREVAHDDLPDFIKNIVGAAKAVFERGDWQWVIGGSDQRKSDATSGSKRSTRSSKSRSR